MLMLMRRQWKVLGQRVVVPLWPCAHIETWGSANLDQDLPAGQHAVLIGERLAQLIKGFKALPANERWRRRPLRFSFPKP